MLRVAPTNQKLREELFKYFLQTGHPETALEVADEGLKIDPYNADLYDLKSNACLFLSNFKCAVDALETMYATDSTKADTLFFTKISAAAAEGEKPDTARLLKWSQAGVKKYPDNPTLLGYLNRAYAMTGPVDSVVAVTNRIIAKDSTAVVPALAAAKALIEAPATGAADHHARRHRQGRGAGATHRTKEAVPFLQFAIQHGDPQQKEQAAALLYTGAPRCSSSRRTFRAPPSCSRWPWRGQPVGQGLSGSQLPAGPGDPLPGTPGGSAGGEGEVLRSGQAGGDAVERRRNRAQRGSVGQPRRSGQEPRHHQAVQAEGGVHEEGLLQVSRPDGGRAALRLRRNPASCPLGNPLYSARVAGAVAQLG